MGSMIGVIERDNRRSEPEPEAPPPPRTARPKFSPRQAFGITIEMVRKREELSQKEIAARANVTEYAIEQLEKGLSPGNATIEDLERIAAGLSCRLEVESSKAWRARTTVNTIFTKGGTFKLRAIPTAIRTKK